MDHEKSVHPILQEIDAFRAVNGIAPCAFGIMALRDPSLISSLRNGREPRARTIAAIRHFMTTGEAAAHRGSNTLNKQAFCPHRTGNDQ